MIKSKGYDGKLWILVHAVGGEPAVVGEAFEDSERVVIGGSAPHKSDSSGRIEVGVEGDQYGDRYFPHACGYKWVPEAQFIAAAMDALLDVIRSGPPEVIGYDHGGPAQKAFDHGWSAAKERIYEAFIVAQRALA